MRPRGALFGTVVEIHVASTRLALRLQLCLHAAARQQKPHRKTPGLVRLVLSSGLGINSENVTAVVKSV